MKTLIINNGSSFIKKLTQLTKGKVKVVPYNKLNKIDIKQYDRLILSGGHKFPASSNNYSQEIKLIKNSKIPILGICLGFELICKAFGSKLGKLSKREKGILNIRLKNQQHKIKVYESHLYSIKNVKRPLQALAKSKYGIEIVKHKTKPIIGVQFHPEIKKGNGGYKILKDFLNKSTFK